MGISRKLLYKYYRHTTKMLSRNSVFSENQPFGRIERFFGNDLDFYTPQPLLYSSQNRLARAAENNSKIIELPGVKPEDLSINVNRKQGSVKIEAKYERKEQRNGCEYTSSGFNKYEFTLPSNAEITSLESMFENGRLRLEWRLKEEKASEGLVSIPVQIIE